MQREELSEVKTIITNNALEFLDFGLLEENAQRKFVQRIYDNDVFLKMLSEAIVDGKGEEVFHSIFKPLRDGNILIDVEVDHVFRISDQGKSYRLEFRQRFRAPSEMAEFFILCSCDNDIFNNIFYLKTCKIDCAIGVSRSEWNKISDTVTSIYLRGEQIKDGKKKSVRFKLDEVSIAEIERRFSLENLDAASLRAFSFRLPQDLSDYQFEFYYEVENSLSDPYYYWIAENPMHLKSVSFNYERIKSHVGVVSANCIMGNQLYEPVHDRVRGIYTVRTDSLVWPGHGGLLVWRPLI
ncbi:hypothetical protein ACWKW6_31810 [Dyadobacter jiangsuensis]